MTFCAVAAVARDTRSSCILAHPFVVRTDACFHIRTSLGTSNPKAGSSFATLVDVSLKFDSSLNRASVLGAVTRRRRRLPQPLGG